MFFNHQSTVLYREGLIFIPLSFSEPSRSESRHESSYRQLARPERGASFSVFVLKTQTTIALQVADLNRSWIEDSFYSTVLGVDINVPVADPTGIWISNLFYQEFSLQI